VAFWRAAQQLYNMDKACVPCYITAVWKASVFWSARCRLLTALFFDVFFVLL